MQLGIIRLHHPLDSQARRPRAAAADNVARSRRDLPRIDQSLAAGLRHAAVGEARRRRVRRYRCRQLGLAPEGSVRQPDNIGPFEEQVRLAPFLLRRRHGAIFSGIAPMAVSKMFHTECSMSGIAEPELRRTRLPMRAMRHHMDDTSHRAGAVPGRAELGSLPFPFVVTRPPIARCLRSNAQAGRA
jgi:hypothetical protein